MSERVKSNMRLREGEAKEWNGRKSEGKKRKKQRRQERKKI